MPFRLKEFGKAVVDDVLEGVTKVGAGGGVGVIDVSLDTSCERSS